MRRCVTGMRRQRGLGSLVSLIVLWGALSMTAGSVQAVENWFEKGLVDIKAGRFQSAVDHFTLALEAVPNDFEALNNRGFARIYTGDYAGAIEDCTRSIAINPGSAKAYNNRGMARMSSGAYDLAITDFDQALAINPRYIDAYGNRCLAWSQKEDYDRAIRDGSEALHLNPRSAKALYCRGYARDRQGNPGGALRDYIQALKVNPDFLEALNSIAWILATSPDDRLRDGQRAVAYAEKVVANAPPDINFLDTLAAAYAEAGRFDEAVSTENRIISVLAFERQTDALAIHVKRMNRYEEGRPYREPVTIQPVSAVTDLDGELAAFDRLVLPPAITSAAYEPTRTDTTMASTPMQPDEAPRALLAQADQTPAVVPEAVSQSIRTPPGVPVEITLSAEQDSGGPLAFEIETVPYQGALRGTLPHLVYTPRSGFEGTDRFTFRVSNANGSSNLATITILVATPPAEAPAEEIVEETLPPAEEPVSPAEAMAEEPDKTIAEPAPAAPTPEAAEPAPADEPAQAAPAPALAEPAPAKEVAQPEPAPAAEAAQPEATEQKVAEPAPAAPAATAPAPATVETGAPEVSAPAPQPVAGLSPDAVYTIQVRSVKSPEGAAAIVAKLMSEGHTAFSQAVEVPEKGLWHRVYINGYPSMAAAKAALEKLDPAQFEGAYIRRIPAGIVPPQAPAAPPQPEPPTAQAAPAKTEPVPEADAGRQAITVSGSYPYAYQIKSFKQKEEAFQLGVELTSQGYKAFIGRGTMGSTGVWYRVYLGCYASPEEAENSREDIARQGFPEAFLTPIGFAVEIQPDINDPSGETLENRLMASGFLPYRLPPAGDAMTRTVLVGGFRHPDDAKQVLAALEQSGFKGQIKPR